MKKYFKLAAIAVVAMGLATACNNNKNAETEDTTVNDSMMMVEECVDTVADTIAEVAPVEEAEKPAAKKTTTTPKKQDVKPTPTKLDENSTPKTTPTQKLAPKKMEQEVAPTNLSKDTKAATPKTKMVKTN